MFVLLLVLLVTVDIGYALQCITDCRLRNYYFNDTFKIPDGRCQQRKSADDCFVTLKFAYHSQSYDVEFSTSAVTSDYIYITSGPFLSYSITYQCSKRTDCVISYAQNRIDEMVGRNYNAQRIYQQIAPLIENPFRNGSIQCYDEKNQIGLCSSNQVCAFIFDQKGNKVKSRGCALNTQGKVSVYDGDSYTQFDIECNRPLCNTDETFQQIKTILIEHRLIDVNGRRIAAGTKQMISYLLMISTLIFIVVYYL